MVVFQNQNHRSPVALLKHVAGWLENALHLGVPDVDFSQHLFGNVAATQVGTLLMLALVAELLLRGEVFLQY